MVQQVDADKSDALFGVLGRQCIQAGLLLATRSTPGGPEDQHGLRLAEVDRQGVAGQRLAGQRWRGRPNPPVGRGLRDIGLERASRQQEDE